MGVHKSWNGKAWAIITAKTVNLKIWVPCSFKYLRNNRKKTSERLKLEEKLVFMEIEKTKGEQIKTGVKWIEEGGKNLPNSL